MKRLSMLALAALVAVAPASASASGSGPILLRAKGPVASKVVVGKPLPGTRLALAGGDVLMLLDGKGVRTLTGPGILQNGAFTRTGPSFTTAGQRIGAVRGKDERRPRIGAVRSAGVEAWTVPLAGISAVCLPADRELSLWRRGAAASAIEVQPVASGAARSLAWPAFAEQVTWPADLPTTPGAKYRLTSQAIGGTREIEFRAVSADDPACAAQIDFNMKLASDAEEQMLDEYLN